MNHTPGKAVLGGLRTAAESVVGGASSVIRGAGSVIRGLGFWTAILLPVLYIPLLVLNHPWVVDVTNLTKVVVLHVASLFVGRDHGGGFDDEQ